MNFIVISLKKYFFTIIFFLFFISIIAFSENNFLATKNGLALWFNSVVPSLLPFFIATELLCKTDFIKIVGNRLHKYIKPIFNVPGESAVAILIGIVSGYPIGAKVVCDLYDQKICSKPEAERLIAYTSNSSPIFILSTIGISLFGNIKIGIILLVSHIFSSLLVGLIFRFWKKDCVELNYRTYDTTKNSLIKLSNLGEILGDAISKSIYNVLLVGGFVVFFSVVLSIISSYGLITRNFKFAIILQYSNIFLIKLDYWNFRINKWSMFNCIFLFNICNHINTNDFIFTWFWRNFYITSNIFYCFKTSYFHKIIYLWKIISRYHFYLLNIFSFTNI